MQYELCYLVGESNESKLDSVKEGVRKILSESKAVISGQETSEKRKMAYQVKKDIRGTYVAIRFELPERDVEEGYDQNALFNITKKMNLDQDILRSLIVKASELPAPKGEKEEAPKKEEIVEKVKEVKVEPKEEVKVEEQVEEKTEEKKEEAPAAPEEKPADKGNDIDKKLDEILNI